MIAMDHTIAGAASGETVGNPRRRRVHNLRQKDRRVLDNSFVILIIVRINKCILFIILIPKRLERIQSLFCYHFHLLFFSHKGSSKWQHKN